MGNFSPANLFLKGILFFQKKSFPFGNNSVHMSEAYSKIHIKMVFCVLPSPSFCCGFAYQRGRVLRSLSGEYFLIFNG